MMMEEIAERVNNLSSSWEEFKKLNDRRLNTEKKTNASDNSTLEMLKRINDSLDENKERLDRLEIAAQRPDLDLSNFNVAHKEFDEYLRNGSFGLEEKSISFANVSEGSAFLPYSLLKRVDSNLTCLSPMRKICSVHKISSGGIDFLVSISDNAFAGWRAETGEVSEDTDSPQIRRILINTSELYAQPQISKKLIEDSIIDVSAWLVDQIIDVFARIESRAFITGNGVNKPKGVLDYGDGKNDIYKIEHVPAKAMNSDSIIKFYYSLADNYFPRANFLMNRNVSQAIRLMKTKDDQYLWQPGLTAGTPDSLLGIPVFQSSDMPDYVENKKDSIVMVFGDFKSAYKIVESYNIKVMRDPYTSKAFVKFYTTKNIGGALIDGRGLRILKITQ